MFNFKSLIAIAAIALLTGCGGENIIAATSMNSLKESVAQMKADMDPAGVEKLEKSLEVFHIKYSNEKELLAALNGKNAGEIHKEAEVILAAMEEEKASKKTQELAAAQAELSKNIAAMEKSLKGYEEKLAELQNAETKLNNHEAMIASYQSRISKSKERIELYKAMSVEEFIKYRK